MIYLYESRIERCRRKTPRDKTIRGKNPANETPGPKTNERHDKGMAESVQKYS